MALSRLLVSNVTPFRIPLYPCPAFKALPVKLLHPLPNCVRQWVLTSSVAVLRGAQHTHMLLWMVSGVSASHAGLQAALDTEMRSPDCGWTTPNLNLRQS